MLIQFITTYSRFMQTVPFQTPDERWIVSVVIIINDG